MNTPPSRVRAGTLLCMSLSAMPWLLIAGFIGVARGELIWAVRHMFHVFH